MAYVTLCHYPNAKVSWHAIARHLIRCVTLSNNAKKSSCVELSALDSQCRTTALRGSRPKIYCWALLRVQHKVQSTIHNVTVILKVMPLLRLIPIPVMLSLWATFFYISAVAWGPKNHGAWPGRVVSAPIIYNATLIGALRRVWLRNVLPICFYFRILLIYFNFFSIIAASICILILQADSFVASSTEI